MRGYIVHNKLKYGLLIFSLFAITCNVQAYQTLTPHNSSQDSMLKSEQVKSGLKNNWSVKKGQTLYGILSDWAVSNGWEVVWETKSNYVINASAEFKNMNIDDAIKNLLVSMGDVQPKIFVRIFDGNRVILVKSDSGI